MRSGHPLDGLLSVPARVRILRALASTRRELTGREAARVAGISSPQGNQALAVLVRQGAVLRRQAGRAGLYRLNDRLLLIRRGLVPLFRLEGKLVQQGLERFRRGLESQGPLSIILFGSRSRGDAGADSDVDVLVVLEHRTPDAEERVRTVASRVSATAGLRFAPLVLSREECLKAKGHKRWVLRAVMEEGKLVHGHRLEDLLNA